VGPRPSFSCVLFKDHPVTFMCSHREKYSRAEPSAVTIQMDEQFSQQHFGNCDEAIGQGIREALPKEMRAWLGRCLAVKRWRPSLIRTKKERKVLEWQRTESGLLLVGDVWKGSSRVANALEASAVVFLNFLKSQ
jgi:predicted NAD/FAD-dependent oxidoreductase